MLKGALHKARHWLSAHKKPVIWILILLVVLCVGFYVWLRFFFFFGDDLIMQFDANQTSFRITNADRAPVTVTITTTNQILCDAQCGLELNNISTQLENPPENFTLKPHQGKQANFSLSPGDKGTGQEIYSVTASCHNINSFLCPSSSPERSKSILLTVNYGLTVTETEAKPQAQAQVTAMLELLRDADFAIQDVRAALDTQGVRTDALIVNLSAVEQEYYDASLFLETARSLWQEESYNALRDILNTSKVTPASINATRSEALGIVDKVQSLVVEHNQLRDSLDAARSQAFSVIKASPIGTDDPVLGGQMLDIARTSDALVTEYRVGNITIPAVFKGHVAALAENALRLNASIGLRVASLVVDGNAVIVAQKQSLCAANVTCLDFNVASNATSNETTLSGVCGAISALAAHGLSNATLNYDADTCHAPVIPPMDIAPLQVIGIAQVLNHTSSVDVVLTENPPQCCVFGKCGTCCNTAQCNDDPATYPVVFVHGHAFNGGNSPEYSLGGYFQGIQRQMQTDGYLDAGIITPSSTFDEAAPGEWGLSGRPVTARVTYYYNFYKSGTDYVLITQKSENIETYAIRLKEMIDIVKHHTGKQKVDIVAHSMGGLVVRRYLQLFGEDSVGKVILIATPDSGISGRTLQYCGVLGASKECADMANDSVFMRKLNDAGNQPTTVKFVTIAGSGCNVDGKDGDGVTSVASVGLANATNYIVNGTCPDAFGTDLHTEILNIEKYPVVYDILKKELRS